MNPTALVTAILLLLANAFFVGAEFALTAARATRLQEMAAGGSGAAQHALRSARELSVMLAGAQLGITMASLGLGYVAEPAVAHGIESALHATNLHLPPGVLHTASFTLALAVVVFLHMVLGEMAPKNVAIAQPEKTALLLAVPFRLYVNVFRPAIAGMNGLANAALRLLGVDPQDRILAAHTSREIKTMIEESAREGMLDRFERRLLSGAIEFSERVAGEAMVPRTEIDAVPITATPADVERAVLDTGHSRLPVFAGDLDHVVGFVHAKDMLRVSPQDRDKPLSQRWMRPMLVVPETRRLQPLLLEMRRERNHFALVVDEHGGTAGLITLEDVLEELVGEIQDEFDLSERAIERLDERRFVVPGTLRIHQAANHLGLRLPEGDYETIAGFLMERLGRIPKRRDTVDHAGWRLRVLAMHRRTVLRVLVERLDEELAVEEAQVAEDAS